MSIEHEHDPILTVLHPAWCDPECHDNTGQLDQWCRSQIQRIELLTSLPGDLDGIEISVDQYHGRSLGETEWNSHPARVLLRGIRDGGSEMTPAETVAVARTLLAAQAICDGTAVTW